MSNSNITSISTNSVLDNGGNYIESVLIETLEENHFRLLRSPGIASGLAAGDEFELTENEPQGFRLLRRGGDICVQVFVHGKHAEECRRVLEPLSQQIGGRLDGYAAFPTRANLAFTFPLECGFKKIEDFAEMGRDISPEFFGWYYGNVYDPVDGMTPLNWWNK